MLYLDHESGFRLKAFSSSSRGDTALIKIEVEVSNLSEMGYALSGLQRQMEKQKEADRAKRQAASKLPVGRQKRVEQQKLLLIEKKA